MKKELVFRAGKPEDLDQIREMTKEIWGGDDYLPHVWHDWAASPNSHLRVATIGDEIVASGRIQELSPGYWWLEGLRVHPAHQGKGYATPLHNHLVALALNSAVGLYYYLRILLSACRPVAAPLFHPLCASDGFMLGGVTVLSLLLGVFPAPVFDLIRSLVAAGVP